jgi:hypothetical protein
MRILFDECMPVRLRSELSDLDIATVAEMGWSGKKNGELLSLLAEAGFDVFVTVDQSLPYQQNLQMAGPVSVLVLQPKRNTVEHLLPLLSSIRDSLAVIRPGDLVRISS